MTLAILLCIGAFIIWLNMLVNAATSTQLGALIGAEITDAFLIVVMVLAAVVLL